MALTTLTALKIQLGIASSDSSQDAKLTQMLGAASDAIRGYLQQYVGGLILSASVANPTVITSPGHGLSTGDVIVIAGSNSTPTIDGERTVTVIDQDTFSISVNVSSAGSAGSFGRTFTEYLDGNGEARIRLRQRPVQSVASLHLDSAGYYGSAPGAFAAATELTEGTDFAVLPDGTGRLLRIGGVWPGGLARSPGRLMAHQVPGRGNIKVVYTAGFAPIPERIQLACRMMVATIDRLAATGAAMQSESFEYYQYTLAETSADAAEFGSIRQLLAQNRPLVF